MLFFAVWYIYIFFVRAFTPTLFFQKFIFLSFQFSKNSSFILIFFIYFRLSTFWETEKLWGTARWELFVGTVAHQGFGRWTLFRTSRDRTHSHYRWQPTRRSSPLLRRISELQTPPAPSVFFVTISLKPRFLGLYKDRCKLLLIFFPSLNSFID